jgi:hypothetical protein
MNDDQHRQVGLADGYEVCEKLYRLTINTIIDSDFMVTQSSKITTFPYCEL